MLAEVASAAVRDDADGSVAEIERERGSGALRWKTTVAGSGASMWSRVVKEPAFTEMTVPLRMESMVNLTSREVRGRPSWSGRRCGDERSRSAGRGFPADGEEGLEAEVLVTADEGVEEEGVDVLGLGVDADAGSRLVGLDSMSMVTGVGVGIFGAAESRVQVQGQGAENSDKQTRGPSRVALRMTTQAKHR